MKAVCRGSNLRALINDEIIMASMPDFVRSILRLRDEDVRGTRISDFRSIGEEIILQGPHNRDHLLDLRSYREMQAWVNSQDDGVSIDGDRPMLERKVKSFRKAVISGARYYTMDTSERNSNIAFYGSNGEFEIGQITRIFVHPEAFQRGSTKNEVFMEVECFQRLNEQDATLDAYAPFGFVGGFLRYDRYIPIPLVIEAASVHCHVAKTKIGAPFGITTECIHVMLLDQVRPAADCPRALSDMTRSAPDQSHDASRIISGWG